MCIHITGELRRKSGTGYVIRKKTDKSNVFFSPFQKYTMKPNKWYRAEIRRWNIYDCKITQRIYNSIPHKHSTMGFHFLPSLKYAKKMFKNIWWHQKDIVLFKIKYHEGQKKGYTIYVGDGMDGIPCATALKIKLVEQIMLK